ncbi:MAG: hypothetical protein JSU04_03475 [Bdellovibrionales bacterium]|nr:hypothetical protein [Bdellovibrionales bacterium]
MTKKILIFCAAMMLGACVKASTSENKKDQTSMSSSKVESNAKEDFEAVLSGKKPIHAIPDPKKPDLSDGGTTFYVGEGYTLTVKSTLDEKKGVKGYMYGPIIIFENIKTNGKAKEMSNVRFYSTEELRKIRGY